MKKLIRFGRRGFIGSALVSAGAAIGWFSRKFQGPSVIRKTKPTSKSSRFVYDVSEFEKTDPKHIMYKASGSFETGFTRVDRIELNSSNNQILVAGDRSVKVFKENGEMVHEIQLERPPHCLHVSKDNELFIGLGNHFEIHDFSGNLKVKSPRMEGQSFLTGIAVHEDKVYLADAGNREVVVCNREGNVLDRFGKKDKQRSNPGFAIPSPYFDLEVTADNQLNIANTGRLRMEVYSLDGVFQSSWGGPGMRIDRFCGCCNPVYFTRTHEGNFVTSEKGLARINVYDSEGKFKGAVAGPDHLVENKTKSRKSLTDAKAKGGFDIAVNREGVVFALDPFKQTVRLFKVKTTV